MTEWLRRLFRGVLDGIARFLIPLGITPNTVTILGLLGSLIAGAFLAAGNIRLGGALMLLMGCLDAVDGALARLGGNETAFGAFLDSVFDRYSELAIFFGLLVYAIRIDNNQILFWVFLAAVGSLQVSYMRARAEALHADCEVGLLTRVERYLVLVLALLFGQPLIGLVVIALLANITAFQRIWHVRKQLPD